MSNEHAKRQHLAAEDARNELARAQRLVGEHQEHEADVRRLIHERHARRMHPLIGTSNRPSDDFEGCVE